MLFFAITTVLLPPAIKRIAADLVLEIPQLTRVITTQFIAFFFAALLAGALSDRWGKLLMLRYSTMLIILGTALWGVTQHIVTAHFAAVLMGLGGGTLQNQGTAFLSDLFSHRRKAVLNFIQVAFCAGAAATPALMAALLPHGVSWRIFYFATAALGLFVFIPYLLLPNYKDLTSSGLKCTAKPDAHPVRKLSLWLLAIALFGYVMTESGLNVGATLYLLEHLATPERWAMLGVTIFWVGVLIGRMLGTVLPERIPTIPFLLALSFASFILVALQGIVSDWRYSLMLFGLSGLTFATIWPLIVALTAARHPEQSGSAVGFVIAAGSLGIIAAPILLENLQQVNKLALFYPILSIGLLATLLAAFKKTST
ncbi:MAG: MFS transporter [Lentisphaerae bacterium]|nr:MFS transporter [Lentisphaerota bacterium]